MCNIAIVVDAPGQTEARGGGRGGGRGRGTRGTRGTRGRGRGRITDSQQARRERETQFMDTSSEEEERLAYCGIKYLSHAI